MSRHRTWCFTLNNYDEDIIDYLMDEERLEVQYICFAKEFCPTTNTPHLQGWVHFRERVSLRACKTKLGRNRFHVEQCKGNYRQNEEYCRKTREEDQFPNEEVFSRGTMPVDRAQLQKDRWEHAWACAKAGDFESIAADIRVKQYNVLMRIKNDTMAEREKLTLPDITNEWYYGASGTGKSRKAREDNPLAYLKMCNKWWDGYKDEEVVLIEDFDCKHNILCHHLKIWADRYPFLMEVKGGARKIRPTKIIITSNYHPREIWTNESDLEPILRRFTIVNFATIAS
jgi:hypothetical protein